MNDEPYFSRANGKELWVLILEKAWAKIHGSYLRIRGGNAYHAMRDLTGAPSYFYDIGKIDVWSEIEASLEKGYMICCNTKSEVP